MLRIYFMQQCFILFDPEMEEALFEVPLYREFPALSAGMTRSPDKAPFFRLRHQLARHGLAAQTLAAVNETLRGKTLDAKGWSAVDAILLGVPETVLELGIQNEVFVGSVRTMLANVSTTSACVHCVH
ncbi:transposase [Caballeronia sp. 15711]|uniref:transposase n=1 Tax=Caballeronia sp. 15711 TaxID=3391029 RepID=UPI0039E241FC